MPVFIEDDSGGALHLPEKSSGQVTFSFADENGADVIPSSVVWSLTNDDGTVINSRDQEAAVAAASVAVVLSGDDLQVLTAEASLKTVKRHVIVEAVVTTDMGTDLPLMGEGIFYVDNLAKIAAT